MYADAPVWSLDADGHDMTNEHPAPTHPVIWPIVLAMCAVSGTLATACMMPFVAVATIAAATMTRGQATVAVIGAWAANQLLGFGLLGYPLTGYAIGWGVALGVASLAVVPVVRRIADGSAMRLMLGFAAAFALWEGLLFGFALAMGGTGTFTPAIIATLLANEAAWLAALAAVHLIAAHGAPRLFGHARLVRLA